MTVAARAFTSERLTGPAALVGLAIAWEVAGRLSDALFFPALSEIVAAWLRLVASGELVEASQVSLLTLVLGYTAGVVLGLIVGSAMGLFSPVRHLLELYVNTFMAAPLIALLPLIALFIGLGLEARSFVVFLFAFFPVVLSSEAAIRSVDPSLVEMGRSFGMSWTKRLFLIVTPGAFPAILAGAHLALVRAIGGVVAAEIFLASAGLGRLMFFYGQSFRPAELFAVILTVVVVAVIVGGGLGVVVRRVGRWQHGLHVE